MSEDVTSGTLAREQEQTTTFQTDAEIVTAKVNKPMSIERAFFDTVPSARTESIKDFLGKPFKIQSGVFSTIDTVSTFAPLWIPDSPFTQTFYGEKLKGFMGIRMTVKFRIVFNSTRFQQGRYMLLWYPMGGAAANARNIDWYAAHTSSLTQRTQCPRVEFDLNCDSEAILEIPYRSALNYYPCSVLGDAGNFGQLGRACIFPYDPLTVDTGLQTCSYSLYISFHDVELIGAAMAQAGKMKSSVKKKNPTEVEQKSKEIGPVECAMKIGYYVSTGLSFVPVLSEFAIPAAWVFDALAGTANYFGWSKPANLSTAHRVIQSYAPYFGSVDNDDTSLPLAGCVNNLVDPALGFSGTDIDEMDFKFFASVPAFLTKVTWNTTQAVDTKLYEVELTPAKFFNARPLDLPGVLDLTPINFVTRYFRYWRGSLVFTIKIVKTEFHSGRLMFVWLPWENFYSGGQTLATGLNWYNNRHILDVRECNEITITIPYMNSAPYIDVDHPYWTGYFQINVEDKLVCPNTVSSSISLLIEVAGGPDFEVAMPKPCNLTPVMKATPQSGKMVEGCDAGTVVVGNSQIHEDAVVNASFCIGEKISSWRTLLKMFDTCVPTVAPVSSSYKSFVPFSYPVITAHATTPVLPASVCDLYGTLSSCYLFTRGGVRLKMVVLNDSVATKGVSALMAFIKHLPSTAPSSIRVFTDGIASMSGGVANAADFGLTPKVMARVADTQPLEISVPQYNRYHSRVSHDLFASTDYPSGFGRPSLNTQWVVEVQPLGVVATNAYRSLWFRAAGEDCNMGGFISIPPMALLAGAPLN